MLAALRHTSVLTNGRRASSPWRSPVGLLVLKYLTLGTKISQISGKPILGNWGSTCGRYIYVGTSGGSIVAIDQEADAADKSLSVVQVLSLLALLVQRYKY